MNATFLKVLKEVLLGLPIMELNVKSGTGKLEEEDSGPKGFLAGVDLCLGAMRSLSEREREREREREGNRTQSQSKNRNERVRMHEICMNM